MALENSKVVQKKEQACFTCLMHLMENWTVTTVFSNYRNCVGIACMLTASSAIVLPQ